MYTVYRQKQLGGANEKTFERNYWELTNTELAPPPPYSLVFSTFVDDTYI